MKLSDLFETVSHAIIFESSNEPLVLQATQRFRRNFRRNWQLNQRVVGEFKQFIEHKQASSNTPFGIKDTAFIDPSHRGLKGWWHAHLHYGKAIVIYRVIGNKLILADIVDHKSVEGGSNAIQALAAYLTLVDQGLAGTATSASSQVSNLSSQELVDFGIERPQEPVITQATPISLEPMSNLIYDAAITDREMISAYLQGTSNDFLEFFPIAYPDKTSEELSAIAVTYKDSINEIIDQALKDIPA